MDSGDDAAVLAGTDAESSNTAESAESAESANASKEADPDGQDGQEGQDGQDGQDEATSGKRGAPIWLATMVALVIALVAGVVVAVNYVGKANAVDATNSGRQAALKTASTAVVDMITTDYRHPDEYIAKLKPLAAGQFLSTFVNAGKGLTSILQQGKVQTTGRVVSSGVQKYAGNTATITVVAYETVKNTQTPQGSQRAYRMVLSMIKSGNQWLVSNVEFVQ